MSEFKGVPMRMSDALHETLEVVRVRRRWPEGIWYWFVGGFCAGLFGLCMWLLWAQPWR